MLISFMSPKGKHERNRPNDAFQRLGEWLNRKFRYKTACNTSRKCILHIGPHKTGSTSIQLTLHRDREILEKYGAYYLNAGSSNHSWLISSAFADKLNINYHRIVKQGKGLNYAKYDRKTALSILKNNITSNNHPLFIISAEDIAAFHSAELIKLKKFLDAHFDSTIIVGFVRPPMSFAISYAQQILQSQGTYDDLCENPPVANYRQYFEKFYSIWGEDKIILKPFLPTAFSNYCVVSEFLDTVGLDANLYKELTIPKSNQSISIKAAKLISLYRGKSTSTDFDKNTNRKICNKLLKLPGEKFYLPVEALEKALRLSEKDINWIQSKINCQLSDFDYKPGVFASSHQSEFNSFTNKDLNLFLQEYGFQTKIL